ncbi:hypothetical protein B7494_g746 [Chlorociboria aeruginascens]|nr:hypothetical protein B7494_g746 [Chlorociboria aeruginascens]
MAGSSAGFVPPDDSAIFDADPLDGEEDDVVSFKRNPQPSAGSKFLGAFLGNESSQRNPSPRSGVGTPNNSRFLALDTLGVGRDGSNLSATPKDGAPWHAEGPGRRVGYEDETSIDWIFEYGKERQRLRLLYSRATGLVGYLQQFWDSSEVWFSLILTGLAVGVLAAGIDIVSDFLGDLKGGYCSAGTDGGRFYLNKYFCCFGYDEFAQCRDWVPWNVALHITSSGGTWFIAYFFFVIFSVTFALTASVLVKEYALYAKHSGIPEIKAILGGGIWDVASNINGNEARKREVLSAAAAAGISVAFGSPIGGVLFSLEQLSYYFPDKTMWQSFVCAMTAAVTLQAFDPFRSGKLVLYQGIYGGLFIKLNMKIANWKKAAPWLPRPIIQVMIVAILTALINYPNFYMRAQSSELVYSLFAECSRITDDQFGLCKTGVATAGTIFLLIFAAILGFFLASITFGLQIPAGIILPSMAIGALFGRAVGIMMEIFVQRYPQLFLFSSCEPDIPCITPGTYAIIGAAAALGGVSRMTISVVVITFELTGALTYVLPIMIAVMMSKWVGDAFGKRGIYESWIELNGFLYLDNSDGAQIPNIPVNQVMTKDLVVLSETGHTIQSLKSILQLHSYRGFPVVSDESILLGYISRSELLYNIQIATQPPRSLLPETEVFFSHQPLADQRTTLDLRPWVDSTPITLPLRSNLLLTANYFQKLGLRYILFTERGVLGGLLTKKDVWLALNSAEETRANAPESFVNMGLTREERALLVREGEAGDRTLLTSEENDIL